MLLLQRTQADAAVSCQRAANPRRAALQLMDESTATIRHEHAAELFSERTSSA